MYRNNIYIFSPVKATDSKYKTKWLELLFSTVYSEGIPDDSRLKKVVGYLQENMMREPNSSDMEALNSMR